jgi:hypothetical protein
MSFTHTAASAAASLLLATVMAAASAQHAGHGVAPSAYAGLQAREIKALSAEQVAELRQGRGMGASLPAELNGVPGPLHVLELAERLEVSAAQRASLERIAADMKRSAQRLGEELIAAEARLDAAFKSGTADERVIAESTARIGALQGQLRAVHLIAHLETRRLLTAGQVDAYQAARGYAAAAPRDPHKH